mmetsp:Transcript_71304/g.190385  ORF Transcript_71304/g.190385 Transcript_71304/m.190385 type:complete len:83 (+) Transcript_71304:304-552(+)
MRSNPYHNWQHVFDVTQTLFVLGMQSGLLERIDPLERLAIVIASLCHDVDHPGVTNSFILKHQAYIFDNYGINADCLEHHHM